MQRSHLILFTLLFLHFLTGQSNALADDGFIDLDKETPVKSAPAETSKQIIQSKQLTQNPDAPLYKQEETKINELQVEGVNIGETSVKGVQINEMQIKGVTITEREISSTEISEGQIRAGDADIKETEISGQFK